MMRKPPENVGEHFDPVLKRLYLEPSRLREKGVEYLVAAVLSVRFRHFISASALKDAASIINRGYDKMLRSKRLRKHSKMAE